MNAHTMRTINEALNGLVPSDNPTMEQKACIRILTDAVNELEERREQGERVRLILQALRNEALEGVR